MQENQKKRINLKERIGGAVYVLLLFGAGVGICSWYLLSRYNTSRIFVEKKMVIAKMKRQSDFRNTQADFRGLCDSLVLRIENFNSGINASYEENDIKFIINELRAQYEQNPWDKRYKAFYHVAGLYEMWFTDKKELWSKYANISAFRQNLEECEIGLQKLTK